MQRIHTVVAVLMLVLWAPVQSHCLWERTGLVGNVCCGSETPARENPAQSPCEEKACCTLENPTYKLSDQQLVVVARVSETIARWLEPLEAASVSPHRPGGFLTVAAPDLPVTWQFSYRTALPPRAPSLLA